MRDTDRLEKCLVMFTIILSKNGRTELLFFQLFIDRLSVRRRGGPGPRSAASGRGCRDPARAGGPGGRGPGRACGGVGSGPAAPLPRPRAPRPRPSQAPRARLPGRPPAPPLRLGPHFRLVSGHSGLGFPAAAGFAAVDLRAHLREKKESKPGRPTRARSSSLCAAREGSWGQATQGALEGPTRPATRALSARLGSGRRSPAPASHMTTPAPEAGAPRPRPLGQWGPSRCDGAGSRGACARGPRRLGAERAGSWGVRGALRGPGLRSALRCRFV